MRRTQLPRIETNVDPLPYFVNHPNYVAVVRTMFSPWLNHLE
jgi:hypothetical protein